MNDFLVYALLLFAALMAWHYVYETIIAPTIQFFIRNRLFALRDELLRLMIDGQIHEVAFDHMENSLSIAIAVQEEVSPFDLRDHERTMAQNEGYRQQVAQRRKNLDAHSNDAIRSVEARLVNLLSGALATNSGAWAPYLLMLILPLFFLKYFRRRTERALRPLLISPLSPEMIVRGAFTASHRNVQHAT